ncbi:MAG TPA: OmpA family protein [Bacteroidia bacterium]|nr:OmpA family protein [Bacteroidia bacterium]
MKGILSIFSLFFALVSASQTIIDKNLVPNGSFENYKKKSENIKNALPWKGIATVDYYQKPIENDTTRCKGARTGDCYAGLRFQKKYKEFLEVKLAESLRHGQLYEFECSIRLAFWSNAQLKSFGVYFSKAGMKAVSYPERDYIVDTVAKKGALDGHFCWFKIKGVYKAGGGEKFITIGNFSPNVRKDMAKINLFKPGFKEAYYFVDDVSLKWIKPKEDEIKIVYVDSVKYEKDSVLQVKTNAHVGEKITLKISFELGKSYLTPESFPELNKLSQYMFRHPNFVIQINGHSDNTGSKRKNLRLSEERARAVFEYLIGKGVQNKMYYKGFGDTMPVADNSTDEGKQKNRRVEFEIIKE